MFSSYFSFLHEHGPVLSLRLIYYIDLYRVDCHSIRQITLANGNYEKTHLFSKAVKFKLYEKKMG